MLFLYRGVTLSGTFKTRSATPTITVATKTASDFTRCKTCRASFRSSNRASRFLCAVTTDLFSTQIRNLSKSGEPSGVGSPMSKSIFLFRAPGV